MYGRIRGSTRHLAQSQISHTYKPSSPPPPLPASFLIDPLRPSLLLEGGYEIDVVFTSRLKRAIRSTWLLLQELNEEYLPVFKSWRLNERMYGALTGLGKAETAEQLGQELVQSW